MFFKGDRAKGGVALEYLVVSVFATVLAFGFMVLSANLLKERVSILLDKYGLESFEEDLDFLDLG